MSSGCGSYGRSVSIASIRVGMGARSVTVVGGCIVEEGVHRRQPLLMIIVLLLLLLLQPKELVVLQLAVVLRFRVAIAATELKTCHGRDHPSNGTDSTTVSDGMLILCKGYSRRRNGSTDRWGCRVLWLWLCL